MTVSNGEYLRVAARQVGSNGQDLVNVFHYRCDFATPQTESAVLTGILNDIDAAYTNLNAQISSAVNPVDLKVDVVQLVGGIETVTRNVGTIPWTGTYNPSASGDDMPALAPALVKLLTSVGKVYGRKYISGWMEAHGVSGFIDSALQTALSTCFTALINVVTLSAGNSLYPGVLSKRTGTFQDFVAVVVSAVVAKMGSRKPYVGS